MALSNREISEVATKIRDQLSLRSLSGYSELSKELAMLVVSIERLKNFGRRLELCAARKWQAAAAVVSREVVNTLPCLVRDIGAVESSANRLDTAIPSLGELVAELRQSEREFGQLSYDRKERFVAAVTDPIELEGMHLGEFEIRLLLDSHCSRQDQDKRYRIVALDPHPAGSDETVTHPHVRGEYLCPGDAAAAIRSALRSGRICDFFLLVRSVLGEYNPQSAFITLANWDGTACYECGYTIGSGEVYGSPVASTTLQRVHIYVLQMRRKPLPKLSGGVHCVQRERLFRLSDPMPRLSKGNLSVMPRGRSMPL